VSDLVFVLATVAFFAACLAYIEASGRL